MAEELYAVGGGGANLTAAQTVQTQNCVDMTLAGNSTSAGAGYILISSGTLTLAGGANITLSQNGNHVTISGGAGGAFSGGVSSGGNTLGTTGTVGNGLLFVGGTNITLSQSSAAGGATITLVGPAPGTTQSAQTGISGIAGSGASTVTNGTVQFANSNGLTFGLNGSTITGSYTVPVVPVLSLGVSTFGNSAGTTGTVSNQLILVGGSNISLSQSSGAGGATVTINGADTVGHFSAGISDGNTLGSTGIGSQFLKLVGGSNITLSGSTDGGPNLTVTILGPANQTGISGIAGSGASTVTAGTVQFGNLNGVSFGLNGSTMTASYTQSVRPLVSKFYAFPQGAITSSQQVQASASIQMVEIPYDLSFTRVDVPILVSLASSATANTGNILISSGLVIYSVSNVSTLNPITGSFGTTTHTWASNSANFANVSGPRMASFALATTLSAGYYYVGLQLSTNNNSSIGTATTQLGNTISVLLGSIYTASAFADLGSAGANTTNFVFGQGILNGTITGTGQSLNIGNIVQNAGSNGQANFPVMFRNF